MRYAVFSDIHANLEALEAVLAKIDEIAQQEPIDEIWFLGDLVGYGPNPNECIEKLRERTSVIIAGNHDWAAVGKISLEDFSQAARISAEWTARQLTEEHREFLANLPERLEFGECTLVHGSPYGPLWEYLTSEVLAERSFQYFDTRYCFVGHTHIPIIFQQPYDIFNMPTTPLNVLENGNSHTEAEDRQAEVDELHENGPQQAKKVVALPVTASVQVAEQALSSYADPVTGQHLSEQKASPAGEDAAQGQPVVEEETTTQVEGEVEPVKNDEGERNGEEVTASELEEEEDEPEETTQLLDTAVDEAIETGEDEQPAEPPIEAETAAVEVASGAVILGTEEDLLALLSLSQSLVQITNEMSIPPEGPWQAKEGYRAIINPGGVGQPRDGDKRAAFMIYDTERGFEFYRVPYAIHKTQEKIIKAGLPSYLAARLAFGR